MPSSHAPTGDALLAATQHLIIELSAGDDPVSGQIGPSMDELIPFHGWTELAAAIERYRKPVAQ